jgi:hypothetical protein
MLLSFGCSHTYGDDLEDKSDAWPYQLGKLAGVDVVNMAMSGNSNEHMLNQMMHSCLDNSDLIVIAWTYKSRRTFYRTDTNHHVNFNIHLRHEMYGNRPEFKDFGKLLYGYWMNDLQTLKDWLHQILWAQAWLKSTNKRYIMLNATSNDLSAFLSEDWSGFPFFHSMDDQQISESRGVIKRYVDLIDRSSYYELLDYAIDNQDFNVGATGHLLEDGHRDTADRIHRFLCSR